MTRAAEQLREPFLELKQLVEAHAPDEQNDYELPFDDYRSADGRELHLDVLKRNPGGQTS